MVDKLDYFIKVNDIPNILLYGGSNKKTEVLSNFMQKIYTDEERKTMVLEINCAESNQGGIKFIRDDLKFFGKSICMKKHKTIILNNGDKLTQDAQSALRRCIEIYSQTTRFILLVDNKDYILTPILSRFCMIHVDNEPIHKRANADISNLFRQLGENHTHKDIVNMAEKMYDKGIHIFNLMDYLERKNTINDEYKYLLLSYIDLLRQNIYNEKFIIFIFLFYYISRCEIHLENIIFN